MQPNVDSSSLAPAQECCSVPPSSRPFSISPFLKNTKLALQLHNNYQLQASLVHDISITRTPVRVVYLSLSYHSKFPRYLQNKLKEASKEKNMHLYVLVYLDIADTHSWFSEIQKIVVLQGEANLLWGNTVQDLRECLEELRLGYGAEEEGRPAQHRNKQGRADRQP